MKQQAPALTLLTSAALIWPRTYDGETLEPPRFAARPAVGHTHLYSLLLSSRLDKVVTASRLAEPWAEQTVAALKELPSVSGRRYTLRAAVSDCKPTTLQYVCVLYPGTGRSDINHSTQLVVSASQNHDAQHTPGTQPQLPACCEAMVAVSAEQRTRQCLGTPVLQVAKSNNTTNQLPQQSPTK
jgi:hypothetical protein